LGHFGDPYFGGILGVGEKVNIHTRIHTKRERGGEIGVKRVKKGQKGGYPKRGPKWGRPRFWGFWSKKWGKYGEKKGEKMDRKGVKMGVEQCEIRDRKKGLKWIISMALY